MRDITSVEDLDRMRFIKGEIERSVLPYRDNTEAALVIGALLQVAKTLLVLYPHETQKLLLTAMVPFLTGERVDLEDELREKRTDIRLLS